MSIYSKRRLSLAGIDVSRYSIEELRALVREILDAKIHGVSFSVYTEGQGPGTVVSSDQIQTRLETISPHVRWIRTFSTTDGNDLIPALAKEHGLQTMVGAWLDGDLEHNEMEIANAIEIGRAGDAAILAVGNEVLLRGDLSEDQLIGYINRVKDAVPEVPVGYVDAYYEFADHPRVTDACDVVLANCYPFWEGCASAYALPYMKDMYRRAVTAAGGKKVIVSETGWPNAGPTLRGGAEPSFENATKYFIDTYRWAEEEGVEIFYFSSFDEAWKVEAEGDVGAFWGLWDKDGNPKYV